MKSYFTNNHLIQSYVITLNFFVHFKQYKIPLDDIVRWIYRMAEMITTETRYYCGELEIRRTSTLKTRGVE